MTAKRRTTRVPHSTPPSASIALFESLSESRISVLYLARRAKETKDISLAKELTKKGQSLKIEMARIRRPLTVEWGKEASVLLKRSKAAQSELAKRVADAEKSARKTKALARALAAVSTPLALAKKAI